MNGDNPATEPKTTASDTNRSRGGPSVFAVYRRIKSLQTVEDLCRAFKDTDWSQVTGPPDLWFNVGTHFSLVDLEDEAIAIWEEGIKEHPQAVDLRCAVFQEHYGLMMDLAAAQRDWEILQQLELRATHWRYFVYGARYLSMTGQEDSSKLLIEGLKTVPVRDVANVYVALSEQTFFMPQDPKGQEEVDNLLREGLKRPLRLGHVLALELSKRAQRRVAGEPDTEKRRELLQEALEYSNLALALYADPGERNNYPVEEVFYQQAQLLIALERYGEALPRLRTIERSADVRLRRKSWFETVKPTRVFCEQMTGDVERLSSLDAAMASLEDAALKDVVSQLQQRPALVDKLLSIFKAPGGD